MPTLRRNGLRRAVRRIQPGGNMLTITPQDKAAFQRDGAVVIRQAFSRHWLEKVEQGIMANIAAPSDHGRYTDPETKLFFQDSDNWRRIAAIERFVRQSPAMELAAGLLGAGKINFLHDHVLAKMPGASQRTLWHQDQPYSPVDGNDFCTLWLPTGAVTRATALEFVAAGAVTRRTAGRRGGGLPCVSGRLAGYAASIGAHPALSSRATPHAKAYQRRRSGAVLPVTI